MRLSTSQSYAIAVVGGAVLWQLTAMLSGAREAWDSAMYWAIAYPLAVVLSGVLAFVNPVRPWRWPLATMLIQPVVMAAFSGSGLSLLPLGLMMFAVLALPPIAVAAGIGARRRRSQLP